jgi:hypothetical protein
MVGLGVKTAAAEEKARVKTFAAERKAAVRRRWDAVLSRKEERDGSLSGGQDKHVETSAEPRVSAGRRWEAVLSRMNKRDLSEGQDKDVNATSAETKISGRVLGRSMVIGRTEKDETA